MLARRGADRVAREPLGAGRRPRPGRRCRPRSRPCSPRGSTGSSPASCQVVQRASVIGRIFGWGAVRALTPEAERDAVAGRARGAAAQGGRLPRCAMLSGEDAYRFGHILVRDAAYQRRAEGEALRAPRAVRLVPRGIDGRPRRRVRGDHRLPPRAGVHVPDAARPGQRRDGGPARTVPTSGSPRQGERALLRGDLPAALNLFQRAAHLARGQCRQGGDADARRPRAR